MKHFNLEKAKAGAPVCTRDGREVRIICWDANYKVNGNPQPIVALINEGDCETLDTFQENGKFFNDKNEDNDDLFMKDPEPTLSDYTTIKTYEDACRALGENPIKYWNIGAWDEEKQDYINISGEERWNHIYALMKLETISKALRNGWKPESGDDTYMVRVERNGDVYTKFGTHQYSCANARLTQESGEKAKYFGTQFIDLWEEYLNVED